MFDVNGLLALIYEYRYFAIFALAFLEGPFVSIIVGLLVSLGNFEIIPAFIALCLGDLVPDTLYYYVGRFGHHKKLVAKYAKRADFIKHNFVLLEKLWEHHPKKTMFFSKLAYGLSTPFLVSAGLVKMKFKKFIALTIPITIFQYGVLFMLGYIFGNSYKLIKYFTYSEYFIAVLLGLFIFAYILFTRYARREITKMEKEEESK